MVTCLDVVPGLFGDAAQAAVAAPAAALIPRIVTASRLEIPPRLFLSIPLLLTHRVDLL